MWKDHTNPAPAPFTLSSGDSLFSWTREYKSPTPAIIDIWFVSPSKGFYIGLDGFIYQSPDSGHTWTKGSQPGVTAGYTLFFVNSQYGFEQGNGTIDITSDGGASWLQKPFITHHATGIFFTSPSTGYYCDGDSGIYKTTDTCNTWKRVFYANSGAPGYYIYFLNADTGFVFSGAGNFYKTTDGAATWQLVATSVVPASYSSNSTPFYTLMFQNALTGYYTSVNGLLKTTNGGISWSVINAQAPLNTNLGINVVSFPGVNTGYYYTNSTIYKTTDAGQSWQVSCKFKNDLLNGLHFIDSTTGWAAGDYIYHLTP